MMKEQTRNNSVEDRSGKGHGKGHALEQRRVATRLHEVAASDFEVFLIRVEADDGCFWMSRLDGDAQGGTAAAEIQHTVAGLYVGVRHEGFHEVVAAQRHAQDRIIKSRQSAPKEGRLVFWLSFHRINSQNKFNIYNISKVRYGGHVGRFQVKEGCRPMRQFGAAGR